MTEPSVLYREGSLIDPCIRGSTVLGMNLGPWLLLPPYEFSVYYCLPLSGFPGHKELQFTLHRPESPDQHSQVRERGGDRSREREREEREG